MMCMNGQVSKCSAQDVEDEARGWFSIAEVGGAEVEDYLHEITAHLYEDLLHLVRVDLHSEGYEVKHSFVLQNRCSVENILVV